MKEQNESIERSLHLFRVLARAFGSIQELSFRDIKSYGLNPTEFSVLELLYHKGPIPLQKIGARLLILSGGVTYTVDKLERSGYVRRRHCESDRRVIYAELTDKGRELLDRIFPQHALALHKALSGLNDEEKDVAAGLMKRLGKEAEQLL